MRIATGIACCLWALLGWGIGEAAAQPIVAGYTVADGAAVIVLADPALAKLTTTHGRLFIGLGTQRDVCRQSALPDRADPSRPVVIEVRRFQVDEVELNRTIERLGRLIRESEKEGGK